MPLDRLTESRKKTRCLLIYWDLHDPVIRNDISYILLLVGVMDSRNSVLLWLTIFSQCRQKAV